LLRDPTLARIGAAHGCSAAAAALAWTIRSATVIAIPESGNVTHVRENAVALSLALTYARESVYFVFKSLLFGSMLIC
jgi:diketogulonate reductase-like aldo/keto reductase